MVTPEQKRNLQSLIGQHLRHFSEHEGRIVLHFTYGEVELQMPPGAAAALEARPRTCTEGGLCLCDCHEDEPAKDGG
jgi:hypothetical protein